MQKDSQSLFPSQDYGLREAFDVVGRQIYGEAWSGYEAEAQPRLRPEEAKKRFDQLWKMVQLAKETGLNVTAKDVYAVRIDEFVDENFADQGLLSDILGEIHDIGHWPKPDSAEYNAQYETYKRYKKAKDELLSALANGCFKARIDDTDSEAQGDPRYDISPQQWKAPSKYFWYNISASTAGYSDGRTPEAGVVEVSGAGLNQLTSLVRKNPVEAGRKGGRQPKYNRGLQEAIDIIVNELVTDGNCTKDIKPGNIKRWLSKKGANSKHPSGNSPSYQVQPYSFNPELPNCDELYVDGQKLVWKDRSGKEKDIQISRLTPYLDRARLKLSSPT